MSERVEGHERWGVAVDAGGIIVCECGERFIGLLDWSTHRLTIQRERAGA